MPQKYDLAVFIGRMQPPTKAHFNCINHALTLANNVLVIFGSANQARTTKNPFTWRERKEMIDSVYQKPNLFFGHIEDNLYSNTEWAASVQKKVDEVSYDLFGNNIPKIALIGHKKDASGFWLDMFPQWNMVETEYIEDVDATKLRDAYFSGEKYDHMMSHGKVWQFLNYFKRNDEYGRLSREWKYIQDYKKSWEAAPYPVVLTCSDAVVIKSGHVLLVTRKSQPGEGLLALPGGYMNQNETFEECMIRELREETKLKVPVPVLKGSIKAKEMFDAPGRSLRGRVVSMAFLIDLGNGPLDKVKGSDDAISAGWCPIGTINQNLLLEDHYFMIKKLLSFSG